MLNFNDSGWALNFYLFIKFFKYEIAMVDKSHTEMNIPLSRICGIPYDLKKTIIYI